MYDTIEQAIGTRYDTIEQAIGTKKAILIDIKENFGGRGCDRVIAKKANGKKLYWLIRYQNGQFSKGFSI